MSPNIQDDKTSNNLRIWRVIDLINWGTEYLSSKEIENSRREVEWFLCSILNCKRIDLYLQFEEPVVGSDLKLYKQYILRRVKGEPFQHILGAAPFYGRDFLVNGDVLVPRSETEVIVEILKSIDPVENLLEIGTGSGCLAITAFLENVAQKGIATDISRDALTVAKQNAQRYNIEGLSFRRHDFLIDPINSQFDCIISNPPYITKTEWPELDPVVKDFDPKQALTDDADGLTFYRRFAEIGDQILTRDGIMLLEMGGEPQIEPILQIFRGQHFIIQFHKDLQGMERVAEIRKTDGS